MADYYLNGYTPPAGVTNSQAVKAIQQQLNTQGAGLKVDGIWGPKTQAAYTGGGTSAAVQTLTSGLSSFMQGIQSLLQAPKVDYQPQSTASLQSQLEASLRPGVDQAIKSRQQQTMRNRAELDADAYARGMGASTYVSDMKDRQMQYEQDDIAAMESQYGATLGKLLMDAVAEENSRAWEAAKHNASMQAEIDRLAFSAAQSAYADYTSYKNSLMAAQQRSGGSGSAASAARATTKENCYAYLSLLSPSERSAIYAGSTSQDRVVRDELIASLGNAGYLQAQSMYPAG